MCRVCKLQKTGCAWTCLLMYSEIDNKKCTCGKTVEQYDEFIIKNDNQLVHRECY